MPGLEWHDDQAAPPLNSLMPAAIAFVERDGKILLVERSDNGKWSNARRHHGVRREPGDKDSPPNPGSENFNNHPAVLIELSIITPVDLRDLLVDAWLATAPAEIVEAFDG